MSADDQNLEKDSLSSVKLPKSPRITGKKNYSGHFCSAPGCTNSSGKDKAKNIVRSYYCFPKDDRRRKLWLAAIPRARWTPSNHTKICSDHFIGGKKTHVPSSSGYIPTVFRGADEAKGKVQRAPRHSKTSQKAGTPTITVSSTLRRKNRRTKRSVPAQSSRSLGRHKNVKPRDETEVHAKAVWNTSDHDYVRCRDTFGSDERSEASVSQCCSREVDLLKEKITAMEREHYETVENFNARILYLEEENKKIISLNTVSDIQKWTSLPNRAVFDALATYLRKRGDKLRYWRGSSDTVKFMVGIAPNLAVNYISSAWGRRASDKKITMESEHLLSGLRSGDSVMADRGFDVGSELHNLGVRLIIPDFKGRGRSQMKRSECVNSEDIASARIHIERIMQRIRTYHVLDKTLRLSMQDITEQLFETCGYLTNFQSPIIR